MIIKLTQTELEELRRYENGPFGEGTFDSFMAEVNARVEGDEIDFDREDRERIETYRQQGHGQSLDLIFKRPMEKADGDFFD